MDEDFEDRPDNFDVDAYIEQTCKLINDWGWAVQHVYASDTSPAMSYTVGLTLFGLPELVVFDLPPEVAQPILNTIGRNQVKDGELENYQEIPDLAGSYMLMALQAEDEFKDMLVVNTIMFDQDFRVFQVVFPDRDHRWPWDPESTFAQILLGIPPSTQDERAEQKTDEPADDTGRK